MSKERDERKPARVVAGRLTRRRLLAATAATAPAGLVLAMATPALAESRIDLPEATDAVTPFRLRVPDGALRDLRHRLAAVWWPERETAADGSQGAQLDRVRALVEYWRTRYDWRRAEATLNGVVSTAPGSTGWESTSSTCGPSTATPCRSPPYRWPDVSTGHVHVGEVVPRVTGVASEDVAAVVESLIAVSVVGGGPSVVVEGAGTGGLGEVRVTVSSSSGWVDNHAWSDATSRPSGIVVDGERSNVSRRTVPGRIAAPALDFAIVAPARRNALVPYRFDNRMRTREPPTLTRTICRTDSSAKPLSDQFGPNRAAVGCCGAVPRRRASLDRHRLPSYAATYVGTVVAKRHRSPGWHAP